MVHVKWRPILGRTTDGRLARYGQEPELDLLMVNLGTSFLASLPTLEKLVALEDRQPMLALAAPPPVARAGNKPAAWPKPKPPPPPIQAAVAAWPTAPKPPPPMPPPPAVEPEEPESERAAVRRKSESSEDEEVTWTPMLEDATIEETGGPEGTTRAWLGPEDQPGEQGGDGGDPEPPAHVQMVNWVPYVDPETLRKYWWHEPTEQWFFTDGDHGWDRFCDGATGRHWWIHQYTGRFFFEE